MPEEGKGDGAEPDCARLSRTPPFSGFLLGPVALQRVSCRIYTRGSLISDSRLEMLPQEILLSPPVGRERVAGWDSRPDRLLGALSEPCKVWC